MTNKNETQHWIEAKGNVKLAETKPEEFVKELLESIQMELGFTFQHGLQGFSLNIVVGDIVLHPDFVIDTFKQRKVLEVDGIHHFTEYQEKKRRWRDSLILKAGYDIIHLDARLCLNKYKSYLRTELKRCIERGSPVELIYA